jgi:peroxiredoxin
MEIIADIARFALALVFLVSGVTKLRDQRGTRLALRNFGFPALGRRLVAVVLPLMEIVFAVLLVPDPTAWWGGFGVALLLLIFTCAMVYQLGRGRTFECHCFGGIDAGPIGPRSVVRNSLLLVLALAVLIVRWSDVRPTLVQVFDAISSVSGMVLALLLVSLGVMATTFCVTVYAYKRLSTQLFALADRLAPSPPILDQRAAPVTPTVLGDPAPVLELPDLHGNIVDVSTFRGEKVLVVFIKPGCWACDALVPELIAWDREPAESGFRLVIISRGSANENLDLAGMRSTVLLSPDAHVANSFGVGGTPGAVFLDADGVVDSAAVLGTPAVTSLLRPTPADMQPATILGSMRRIARQSTQHLAKVFGNGTA